MLKRIFLILLIIFYSETKIAFAEDKPRSSFGYVWLEKINDHDLRQYEQPLPEIGSIVKQEYVDSRYVYTNPDVINKIGRAYDSSNIKCQERGPIGHYGEQRYIGMTPQIFLSPIEKDCGFPALKLKEGRDYITYYSHVKEYKILSYYSYGTLLFALVEFSNNNHKSFFKTQN